MRLENYPWVSSGKGKHKGGYNKDSVHGKYSTRKTVRTQKKSQYQCMRCGEVFPSDERRPRCPKCSYGRVKKAPLGTIKRNPTIKAFGVSPPHMRIVPKSKVIVHGPCSSDRQKRNNKKVLYKCGKKECGHEFKSRYTRPSCPKCGFWRACKLKMGEKET